MTVDELLDRMSSMELTEWMALYTLESREHALVNEQKISPEIAHRMVWLTDVDLTSDEG
jgi:hypothetical protein|tara:strand:+ start:163 stop:339 length:177 start_codon:yes stop_codon:yes gene_type:complete